MSSMILNLHVGLVILLDIICSLELIRGYPFFYFYCAAVSKHNHLEIKKNNVFSKQLCALNKERRIVTLQEVTWVTEGGMLYQIVENVLRN